GSARRNLRERILADSIEISAEHFLCQLLASRRIDAFPDHAEWLLESDNHFASLRGDDGAGHAGAPVSIGRYKEFFISLYTGDQAAFSIFRRNMADHFLRGKRLSPVQNHIKPLRHHGIIRRRLPPP